MVFSCVIAIHPKRWCPRCQDSADNFEFSAERLSENAKSIKITLFAELLTAISPIYVQSLLNLSIKTLKHTICSTKMPHWHQILVIFMIYAILSRNFAVRMYALFPQISLDWKTEFRRRYPFLDVCGAPSLVHHLWCTISGAPSLVHHLWCINLWWCTSGDFYSVYFAVKNPMD